jgi:hypothetical protein
VHRSSGGSHDLVLLFFSDRLGCAGSVALSVGLTLLVVIVLRAV